MTIFILLQRRSPRGEVDATGKRQWWSEVLMEWKSARDAVESRGGGTGNTAKGMTLGPREVGTRWGRRETNGRERRRHLS